MLRTPTLIASLSALSGTLASPALAQLDESDVIIRIAGGRLQTGWFSPCLQAAAYPHRLFVSRFADFDTVSEPGFDAEDGALPPNTQIGFDIVSALRVWNGTDFSQIAQPRLRVRLGPPSNSRLTPLTDTVVPGFGFTTSATGLYHFHYNYTVLSQATPPASPAESGVYLLALRLWSSDAAIAASDPFWIILSQNATDQDLAAAAVAFATANSLELTCGTTPSCPADVNTDGIVDGSDFTAFINSFSIGDATINGAADLNGDGIIDGSDFTDFINAFAAGC